MGNLIKHPAWWAANRSPPPEPPDMDISERVTKIETLLPTLATKEDLAREIGGLRAEMHKEFGSVNKEFGAQTWRIITWVTGLFVTVGGAMVAATYFIARHV